MRSVFQGLPKALIDELGEERAFEIAEKEPQRLRLAVRELVEEITETGGYELAEHLKRDGPLMLARRRAEGRGFEERLAWRWARPFDLAEMAMVVAYEAGGAFNETHWRQAEADNDLVFATLVRLHARACRIAEEGLVLLRAGFGQAAFSRWRVLHEVAVVGAFISEHGQDLAERYLLHEHVEGLRAIKELRARQHRLNESPVPESEQREAQEVVDQLVDRFGARYQDAYGWAHEALAKGKRERVTFAAIEEAVNLDHLRPYYRMASHGTHANPKGILFTPDLMEAQPEVLLAGPGSTGLADPGQCLLLSLNQATATLLASKTGEARLSRSS